MAENKKEKKVVVKKEKNNKAVWLGSSILLAKATDPKEIKNHAMMKMTARVLNVSPFGVNILGSVPYINKLGLAEKAEQYGKGKQGFEYDWKQMATDEEMKAVCACRVTMGGKAVTDWVLGECSPSTIKMGTLKGYQNHMAQTRAKNRAILEWIGTKIHNEMMENIYLLYGKKEVDDRQAGALASLAGKSSTVSIEEVSSDKPDKKQEDEIVSIGRDLFGGNVDKKSDSLPKEKKYKCSKTGVEISKQEYDFSMKMYGKALSRDAQKSAKRIK